THSARPLRSGPAGAHSGPRRRSSAWSSPQGPALGESGPQADCMFPSPPWRGGAWGPGPGPGDDRDGTRLLRCRETPRTSIALFLPRTVRRAGLVAVREVMEMPIILVLMLMLVALAGVGAYAFFDHTPDQGIVIQNHHFAPVAHW